MAVPCSRPRGATRACGTPFIIRSPKGDRFYLLATDLRIHGNGDWDAAQRFGGKHIEVWESTGLASGDWRLATGYEPPARPRHRSARDPVRTGRCARGLP